MSPPLPAAERARLEAAYRATTYRIHAPAGDIHLRLDVPSPVFAALLTESATRHWAILTACNPASQLQDAAANGEAQARLQQWLKAHGYRWLAGENMAEACDWPPEASCVVLGLPVAAARQCGAIFGQNAVVAGDGDAIPRLQWCR
ncbi:MAG TPA: DUF3293 domain-containing protein [Azospira sp.]|nr:DUF3293 domain-containing protein [Azospira sp.]HNN45674.1 DUF3293 domain-containing protein [Azospira sp.]